MKAVTIPALVIAALFTLMPLFDGAEHLAPLFFVSAFFVAWWIIVFFELIVGLPLTLLLIKVRMESAPMYSFVGLLTGFAFWLVFLSSQNQPVEGATVGGAILLGGFPGAFCGWLWRRYARRDHALSGTQ